MAILVAADVDHAPEQPITTGYDLATAFDEPLVVVTVMSQEDYVDEHDSIADLPEEVQGRSPTETAAGVAGQQVTDAVDAALGEYDRTRVTCTGRIGSPAEEIIAAAEEVDPRYVVVGGRRRSLATQTLFGSVSQAVLRDLDGPVVTVMEPEE